jgi:hypothetical protein
VHQLRTEKMKFGWLVQDKNKITSLLVVQNENEIKWCNLRVIGA